MRSIYVIHDEILCIRKSYLNRYFCLPNELSSDFVIIKKGGHASTPLLEYKSLPILIKRMISEKFGTPENQTYIHHIFPNVHYLQMDVMNKEIRRLRKIIENYKLTI